MTSNKLALRAPALADVPDIESEWHINITNPRARRRINRDGMLGLGESYEQGDWSAEHLDRALHKALVNGPNGMSPSMWAKLAWILLEQRVFNRQVGKSAFNIGKRHYDLGNDLFRCMLDPSMTYTSGYWADAQTLAEAQEAKLDALCRNLDLKQGQHVLDIGCGWGNFAEHAASKYGVRVTGLTVSEEQAKYARQRCEGLPVEILLKDYRDLEGTFDHIASIEMIEAVGRKNLKAFYRVIDRSLKEGGSCALQVISSDMLSRTSNRRFDQFMIWILRYIFPDGYLPKQRELTPPPDTRLHIKSWQRFSDDYDRTLMAWASNFNEHWDEISDMYDENFRRRWNFYLHGCAAIFRAGLISVSQIVYTKGLCPNASA